MVKTDWNKLYTDNKSVYLSNEELIKEVISTLKPQAQILELGAGQGQDAIIMAQSGFNVLATDISPVAIEQIQTFAKDNNLLNLHAEVRDQRNLPAKNYDMIVSVRSLHTLKR